MESSERRYAGWGLLLILALGVGLRWHHLLDRSIWFDEAFTWRMIEYPFGDMLRRTTLDNTPPLYYVLLLGWSECFGDSPLALRSLSVVMGGVAIIAMFLFVREATTWAGRPDVEQSAKGRGTESALLAALLVAISAFQIRWSWDARPYALGAALVLLSSWALFRALRTREHAGHWWCGYAFLAVMFAYTHYFALFSLVVQAGFALYVLSANLSPGESR